MVPPVVVDVSADWPDGMAPVVEGCVLPEVEGDCMLPGDCVVLEVEGACMLPDGLVVVDGVAFGPAGAAGVWTPGPGPELVPVCAVAKPTAPTMAAAATTELKVFETFTEGLLGVIRDTAAPRVEGRLAGQLRNRLVLLASLSGR